MDKDHEGYWETDEFEDLVARSLIGLYETKIKKEKRVPKCVRFDEDIFKRFRSLGCYFPANDRIICANIDDDGKDSLIQEIDIISDGLPEKACYTNTMVADSEYLHSFFMEKVKSLPFPFASERKGTYYRIMQMYFGNTHVSGCGTYISIDNQGIVQSCYLKDFEINPITNRPIHFKNRPVMHSETGCKDFYSTWASATIQLYQDRRHLWNVRAQDGIAKATFAVYPEQIKSLFYSRDVPMTESGRKRPILHWVQSHQRRIKNGDDVDIEKYLRGTHEFVMNGTKYKITNPMKVSK